MVSLLEGIRNGVRGAYCALLASNDFINGGLGLVTPGLRDIATDIYQAQRRFAGCDPEDDVNPPAPQFGGGQCPNVLYEFQVIGTAPTTQGGGQCGAGVTNYNVTNRLWGPIGPIRQANSTCAGPNGTSFRWVMRAFGSGAQGAPSPNASDFTVATTAYDATPINFSRVDGQPDDCGDLDPIYPPPTDIDIDIDITYEGDDGTEININVPFTFAPIKVEFDGSLSIPFNFNLGGITLDGSISFAPNVPININLPSVGTGGGQGTETQPPDQPGESVDPESPEGKIIGVVVTATTIQQGRVSSYDSPGIPEIYVPRLGSVKFVYNLGGATFFSSDIDIKDRRTFIECPFAGGADGVIASPQIGVDFSFLPIRGFPLATVGDLARLS